MSVTIEPLHELVAGDGEGGGGPEEGEELPLDGLEAELGHGDVIGAGGVAREPGVGVAVPEQ